MQVLGRDWQVMQQHAERCRWRESHHNVYVIELNDDVVGFPGFAEQNPNYEPGLACYYVGMTGLTVEDRLKNHLNGVRAGRGVVKRFFVGLEPEFYEILNPMEWKAAVRLEKMLAAYLRNQGYGVWQK